MKILPNTYTTVDISEYYKDWDGDIYQGPKVKYTFKKKSGEEIGLVFFIANHSIGIQWIKNLHDDLTKNKTLGKHNGLLGFGNSSKKDRLTAYDVWCMTSEKINVTHLELDIYNVQTRPVTDMYKVSSFIEYTTNVKLVHSDKSKALDKIWDYNSPVSKSIVAYNTKYQDRDLLTDVDQAQYNAINNGTVHVGVLSHYYVNGKLAMDPTNTYNLCDYDGDLSDAELIGINIGSFMLPPDIR